MSKSHRAARSLKTEQYSELYADVQDIFIPQSFENNMASSHQTIYHGEFDPGSGRTLAACLTHASRTRLQKLAFEAEWQTGE